MKQTISGEWTSQDGAGDMYRYIFNENGTYTYFQISSFSQFSGKPIARISLPGRRIKVPQSGACPLFVR